MPFRWSCNKYMCFFCGCIFNDSSTLKHHTKVEHENPKLKYILTLFNIAAVKLDISEISCKLCPNIIKNLEDFLTHAASDHSFEFNDAVSKDLYSFRLSDGKMSCLECEQEFKFFGTLLSHVYKCHSKSSPYLCDICGQAFVAKLNVKSHIRHVHSKSECEVCRKPFPTQYALIVHMEKEHRQHKLKCPLCPEILGSRYLKKRHLALIHNEQSKQYKCDKCSKIFTEKSKMLDHLGRIHLKEKNVACEICGFKVFNNTYLKLHMVKHNDSRPFQCDVCMKSFQRRKTLDFHKRIHNNDKRYSCKECGKAFVQVTSLKLHTRVHHSNNEGPSWK